jgi:predicted dehydrogenase
MSDEIKNEETAASEPAAGEPTVSGATHAAAPNSTPETAKSADADEGGIGRRDMVRALASIPVLGIFFAAFFSKKGQDETKRQLILNELGISEDAPAIIPHAISQPPSDRIGIGIIGFGGEGEALMRGAGFAHPDWVERMRLNAQANPRDKRYEEFMSQGDLSLDFNAVCDVFDVHAERGLATAGNTERPGGDAGSSGATRYRHYRELLESPDVDAVIIATPDHWHSQMTIDAAASGKHVYLEKAMTRIEEEAHAISAAVKNSGIVFQLGHQNRQLESHEKAREIVEKGIIGPINLVETTTNRNDPIGAWVYEIHPDASPQTIDWEQFQETAGTQVPYSAERFFRWRCWFDYATGLSGDLFSHEYDAINQILNVGIPHSVVSSGGVYFYKDGRDVPDVFQAVCEYPDRDLSLVYSATLSNSRGRGKVFMGHDASMEVGSGLRVIADPGSTKFKGLLEDQVVDTNLPLLSYRPGFRGVDAITSATEEYFASRGLLFTYRGGRRVSTHWLHIGEWLDVIRNGGETSCDIDRGFEEAITCHMITQSYLEERMVKWDPIERKIV